MIVVTTCPRPDGAYYLARMLAGIGMPDEILVDESRRGARWNIWRAVDVASERCVVDRLILLQDDVVLAPGALLTMETMEIPADVGIVNFHDFGADFMPWDRPEPGLHRFPAHKFGSGGMCGAQALVIPIENVRWLAGCDPNHPELPPGPHGADYAIGWWTQKGPRPWKLVVRPSPVTHLGAVSSCHVRDPGYVPQAPLQTFEP